MRISLSLLVFAAAACAQQGRVTPQLASSSLPNLPIQAVGPNDLVTISIYDEPGLSLSVRVGADGFIKLPMLKQKIKADGLYPADLEGAIAKAYVQEQMLVDPYVTVNIAELHSNPISVTGAVKTPVQFQAEGPTLLLEAITKAQGLGPDAGAEILISYTRPGPDGQPIPMKRIPVRALIDNADPALNITLTGGEEIRVPEARKIYVLGNVKKNGIFPLQNDGQTTVRQILALAEGLTPYYTKQAYIERGPVGARVEITVELEKIMKRKAPDVALEANDIFYVPDNTGRRKTAAVLEKMATFASTAGASALIYGVVY